MKRLFKISVAIVAICFVANFAWWFVGHAGNPYSSENIETTLGRALPQGTPKTRVVSWLKKNGFAVLYRGKNVLGRRDNVHHDVIMTTDLMITFNFDDAKKLRSFSVREFYTGP